MKVNVRCENSSVDYLRVIQHGKVEKAVNKDEANSADITACLDRLQELVPFAPKNKRMSTLEVVSCVIDYIQDLRETLGLPPSASQNELDPLDEQFLWSVTNSSPMGTSLMEEDGYSKNQSPSQHLSTLNRQPFVEISSPGGNVSNVFCSTKVLKQSTKYLKKFNSKANPDVLIGRNMSSEDIHV